MKSILLICLCLLVIGCESKKQPNRTSEHSKTTPIEDARSLSIKKDVTVEGTITVASGTYSSSIPFGYALQDETGGIYIIDSIPPMKGAFKLGERVRVNGILVETNGLLALREITATKTGKGEKVVPIHVNTGDINNSNQGLIVHTSGSIDSLVNDSPYGYKVYINDGTGSIDVFVNTSAGFLKDTINWKVSDSLSVTGFSSQYNAIYEIDPRIADDVRIINR